MLIGADFAGRTEDPRGAHQVAELRVIDLRGRPVLLQYLLGHLYINEVDSVCSKNCD